MGFHLRIRKTLVFRRMEMGQRVSLSKTPLQTLIEERDAWKISQEELAIKEAPTSSDLHYYWPLVGYYKCRPPIIPNIPLPDYALSQYKKYVCLPADFFQPVGHLITHLVLDYIEIVPELLNSLPNLRYLEINRSKFTLEDGLSFKEIPSLRCVEIKSTNIHTLAADCFACCPLLKSVQMNECGLRELPSTLFFQNRELLYVDFNDNLLDTVPDKLFQNNLKLSKVSLTGHGHRLTSLPPFLFAINSSLRHVSVHIKVGDCIPDTLFGSYPVPELYWTGGARRHFLIQV